MSAYIREQKVLKQQNRQFCPSASAYGVHTRIIKLIRSPYTGADCLFIHMCAKAFGDACCLYGELREAPFLLNTNLNLNYMKNSHNDFWNQYEVKSDKAETSPKISKKVEKRERLQQKMSQSASFLLMEKTANLMDKYYLDPILGLLPGLGDMLTSAFCLPSVYVALVKVKSIPLTLAVLLNILVDALIGMIPFWIGDFCDFFNRSYLKNLRLVVGYVEGDENIIKEVNNKAIISAILIVLVCVAIYYMVQLAAWVVNWVVGLF